MSGFENSSGNKKYFGMFNGSFSLRKTEEEKNDPGVMCRINKMGKKVYEQYYNEFTGRLCGLSLEVHEQFGSQYVYQFEADGTNYELKLPVKSSQAQAINFRLPNVDLDNEFTLLTFLDNEGHTIIWIKQSGVKIEKFWTKKNPKDLPQAVMKEFDGESKWDFGAQRKYVNEYLKTNIIPKLKPFIGGNASKPEAPPQPEPIMKPGEEIDDLPF